MMKGLYPSQDEFAEKIRVLVWRAADLQQKISTSSEAQQDVLLQTLAELQVSLEELQVAQEELQQQSDQLISAQRDVDIERQRYRDLFELAPDPYVIIDIAGVVQEANRAAAYLFGVAQQSLIGKPLVLYLAREDHTMFYTLLQKFAQAEGVHSWDTIVRPRSGEPVPVNMRAALRRDRQGHACGFQVLLRDMTQPLEAQKQLRELNASLEERVQRRTADLQRSNDELQHFAYVVSHDLQEPLRAISSYTQLLADRYHSQLDSEADEFIEYVVDGAKRMQQLISDLLRYSRVGTQRQAAQCVNCEEILTGALQNLEFAIEENNATITHDPLPYVYADKVQLSQLWQNLLSNAIKYRGAEPPRIHVSAQRQEHEWLFSVRDNGIGVDPKHVERAFVIFQRLHTQSEYPGTGVGLAICKKIVEGHGGRIWVESTAGKGCTFYFTLPEPPVL